jgi:hypothetical protein
MESISMIGMNILGNNGRLGNQMFQYAALVGIAKNMGYEYCIPDHSQFIDAGNAFSVYHQLQHCFEMTHLGNRFGMLDGDELELHQYEFCEELFNECPDNVSLRGYFETEKYFKNVEKEIRKDYTFKDYILEKVVKKFETYLKDNPVSIVVRKFSESFDYHGCELNHRNLPIEYYKKCIDYFGKDRTYIICSNDIDWCKEQDIFKGKNFIFNDTLENNIKKGHYDMCLISLCSDFIVANSSFSWWGAWLSVNKNKRVLCPDPWFGPKQSHLNTDDMIPCDWIKIYE